jgi:hypothetical protein
MTALQLVNAVLRRLRETEVTDFTESYTKLILDFINETKREVEDSWNWTALRTSISIPSVVGQDTYTLTGLGNRFKFLKDGNGEVLCYNTSYQNRLVLVSNTNIYDISTLSTPTPGRPTNFAIVGQDVNNDPIIKFDYPFNHVDTLKFYAVVPQAELSSVTEVLSVPWYPIVQGTWARAISERGEDGGQNTSEQYQMYVTSLSDAIAQDEARVGETNWTTV